MVQIVDEREVMDAVTFQDLEMGDVFTATIHGLKVVCLKTSSFCDGDEPNAYNFTNNICVTFTDCECVVPVKAKLCIFGIHAEV